MRAPYTKQVVTTGDTFNNLTVIGEPTRNNSGHVMYPCRCVCGTEKYIRKGNLGVVLGCGCVRKKYKPKTVKPTRVINDGDVFHDWTVIGKSKKIDDKGEIYFECRCVCGTKRAVRKSSLGKAQGCGCIRKKEGGITVAKIPTKRPKKETKQELVERKRKVSKTLESLVDGETDTLNSAYHLPPIRKTKKGEARAKLDELMAERALKRELDALDYNYDF